MILLSTTPAGRTYRISDVDEAFEFALKYNGKFLPDIEESLRGNYVVII